MAPSANCPTQARGRLEWATRPCWRQKFRRRDRVRASKHVKAHVVEFEAPTFRKGRERWGTPRLWWCRRSAEILRWQSLALPRTPLPQDDVNFPTLASKSTTLGWATLP